MFVKISNDIIRSKNGDMPACNAALQTTAAQHAPYCQQCDIKVVFIPVLQ